MSIGGTVRVVDGAFDALITVDAAQRVVDLNSAAERIFGYTREEALGADMNALIVPPETREAQRKAFDRAISGEPKLLGSGAARFRAMRADGSRFPLELTLNITSEDPLRISAWIHDRTREEIVERQATLSERVENAIGAGSWEWDTQSNVALWSEGLYRIYGYEIDEVEATVDLNLKHVHPDDRERVQRQVQMMVDTGAAEPYEYRIISARGETAHLRVVPATTGAPEGSTVLTGSVLDITEKRAAERRAKLMTAVVEWTAAASDLPLDDAIEMLLDGILEDSEGLVATFWAPKGGLLVCRSTRGVDSLDISELKNACGEVELPSGVGLPGRAWANDGTAYLLAGETNDHRRARAMAEADMFGGIAFAATGQAGTIAVVEILMREPIEASDEGVATLRACGVLVGEFLSHRRGELESTSLTKREIEILQLASEGLTGPKIATHLVISPATVKSHFEHIYPKLGVSDRSNAVAEALRLGLIR